MGNIFNSLIIYPLGSILNFIYEYTSSYGLSLILFTILVKTILLPLTLKQTKSTMEMQKFQPEIQKLQKKYKQNKEKLNEEMMKLYKEHNINPAGGCLPLIIQLPIIFGLYRVIYSPLKYMLKIPVEKIEELGNSFNPPIAATNEIAIAKQSGLINLEFLGLDLAGTASLTSPSILWLIPILAGVTTYLFSSITTKSTQVSGAENNQAAMMTSSMTKVMPIITAVICFQLPAGVGMYWIIANVYSIVQQLILNRVYVPALKEGK
jgi:YidC/Oxa1 family membrane protein insertase